MSTIYTFNNKVLKNSANDKWLTKKEAPAGFVMNESNAIYTLSSGNSKYWVAWQSPTFPDAYNGDGKQYVLVNNNSTVPFTDNLVYGNSPIGAGPSAINSGMKTLGTSTGVLANNVAVRYGFGGYLIWPNPLDTSILEQLQEYMDNVTITILDT